MKNIFILLFVFQVSPFNEAFNLSCPSRAHWNLRAKYMCVRPENYTCLYNVTFQVNVYRERCDTPIITYPGYKLVFQPHPNNATCRETLYQPFIFDSIGYSDCAFRKSHCNGAGQTTYGNGNRTSDRTCSCNTDQGYTFVVNSKNPCYCNPSTEDCSCYIDIHSKNETSGLKDFNCKGEINILQSRSQGEAFNKSQILKNDDFDNIKYNLAGPTNEYRNKAAVCVLILTLSFLLIVGIYIYIVQRIIEQWIDTPGNFEVVEVSDVSITVEWDKNNAENLHEYELVHRRQGSDRWENIKVSAKDMLTKDNGRCVFKFQDLFPETCYEMKMCFLHDNVKGQFTESKYQITLQTAPGNFEVVEVSDVSISVQWDINNAEKLNGYELVHRREGSDRWENIIVSTKDILTKDNGRCVFKFQDLFPETCYEMKMCILHVNVKGQFTETKTQKTLQIAPGNFEVVEVSDVSITVEWDKNNAENLHEYELVHRRQGSDRWENIKVSAKDMLTKDNGRCVFKFQDLFPETCYEMKMCFLHDNVKGQFTESKYQITLQTAPGNFEVVEVSDVSITVEWDKKNAENLHEYGLVHRRQGSDCWENTKVSAKDMLTKDNGRCVFKFQDLFPETCYEMKMCFLLDNVKGQFTESKYQKTLHIAPGNFEVVEVSDVSITVEWDKNNAENLHEYELVHRRQGSDRWENIKVSAKDMLTKDNGRCVFKFQDLFPETCYEMKMCFLHVNVKGQFTESKTQKTLQTAPGNFEVVEVSDRSITVEWDNNIAENLHEYELVHRRQGSDRWENIIVSTKDILKTDNERCVFKFQDLFPETCYDMKLCFLHDNVKGQFAETKTQKTLQIAPENFDVVEVSAVSITVEWDINNTENLLKYKLDHRPQGSDDWKELILSTNDIPINEKRRYVYKHQDLVPGTYYEIRMCSIHDNVKSQSTKPTIRQTLQIDVPAGIKGLSEEDRNKYVKLTTSSEKEKRHFVRIMFVGKETVGKTCLVKRLLKESIADTHSTDGVDIIIRRCKINIESGEWIIDQDISYDKEERLFRALNKHKTERKKKSNFEDTKLPNSDNLKHPKYISPEEKRVDIEQKAPTVENSNLPTIKNNDNNMTMASPPKSEYRNEERISKDVHPINSPEHTVSLENTDNASRMRREKNDSMLTRADTNINIEEIEDDEKLSSLVMPPNLMSDILSNTLSRQSSTKCQYASCGLWDFAGQLEFYATHQAFLTSSAIYILVSSMDDEVEKQDVKQCFAEYKKLGEYVDFWFDNIHCHRTKNEPLNDELEPPVILVFTGKDRHEKAEQETRKQALNKQLFKVIGKQTKYRHYKRTFYLSNTEDSDDEFEVLRNKISEIAQKMGNWGESMPLKWILLEHLIEINKDNGKNFITLNDMLKIAKHPDIAIFDIDEVSLFLRFQCEVGNIIYFEDITSLIILNPQWLSNAFRCLVSDKLDIDDVQNNVQVRLDWNELQEKGKISILLITTLFKLKGGTQFEQQMDDLLKVMKRFDILVEIEDTDSYMMPSMMPISSFETVCNDIGIFDRNCQRSSWFCLKFSFLPPAFFNHLSAWLMKTYKPSIMRDDSEALALYRGICVFNYDRSGCDKLLMTMSTDTIALQVVSFANTGIELGNLCTEVRKGLMRKINGIKKRYKLKISYEQRFKCGDGHYYINTLSFEDLKREKYIYCLQHKKVHECRGIYLPWTMDIVEFTEEEISYLRIVALLHVAEDAVRIVFDYEFHPDVLYKEVNKVKHIIKKYLNRSQWETLCNTRDGKGKGCVKISEKDIKLLYYNVPHIIRKNIESSRKFDLHLMLCFLKNTIYSSINAVYSGMDQSLTPAALSNIWHCRTQMSKNVNGQLAKIDFQHYWSITYRAITVLERYSHNSLTLKCSRIENCDLDDTSEILQTETNYLRILHLILHVAREVFQEHFDKEFLPSTLRQTIQSNKKMLQELQIEQRLITSYQLELLFSIKAKSDLLDIRTMAMLMVHLKNINISNGLPIGDSSTDYRADLSRILWYRRQVMHRKKFTLDEFDDLWNNISEAVQRLGGARYTAICKQLKTSPLHASEP